MIWMRRIHKWLGLLVGLQLFLWMLSGLIMGLLPHDLVQGNHNRSAKAPATSLGSSGTFVQPMSQQTIQSATLSNFMGKPAMQVVTEEGISLYDAATGKLIAIDESRAILLAKTEYSGPGNIVTADRLVAPFQDLRRHSGPVWRIQFDDTESTTIYLSANDGRSLVHRNTYWQVFDFVWMLHTMDYQGRDNFNNNLVIIIALIALWIGVTGLVLWFDSFKRADFAFVQRWRQRGTLFKIDIRDSEGGAHKTVSVKPLQSLFDGMVDAGHPLPSSCGGGGICGLCRIETSPHMSILPADRRQIPETELAQGYRLACQHHINGPLTVKLPHGLLDAKSHKVKIIKTQFVTPFIYEMRLDLANGDKLEFRAGSYVQVTVPPFSSTLEKLNVPDAVREFWLSSGTPTDFGTESKLYRTYSLANAPIETEREIVLNIRLALPKPDRQGVPVGIGSAYLVNLKPGDEVELKGPFGDFHVITPDREMVFIGGGAGMAPIRSMIREQLVGEQSDTKISFWYGARTPRDLLYRDEFDALETTYSRFTWSYAFSEVTDRGAAHEETGFIHDIVKRRFLNDHPNRGQCCFYICGPPPMLTAVLAMLSELGVPKDSITFDDFGT